MRIIKILLAVLFSIALASCGGGGGGGGSTPTSTTRNISGTVAGAANVTINLTGTASKTTTTDANGNYSFTGLANGSYTVTPSSAGHVFSPVSTAVNVNGANVTGKNTAAMASTAATYCLSGTVTGAVVKNVTIFLNGTNTGSTVTDASGNYTFCGLVNGNYTVSALLSGYSITTSSTITISGANPPSTNLVATVAPSGSSVVFVPLNPLPTATVGTAYNNTVVSSTTGGASPYHYQSDTFANGAPPIGLIVDLNGNLTGTPKVAGTYSFGVCAVDMVGSSSCKTTSIIVKPIAAAAANDGTWNLQVAIDTCYEFTQTTPITITAGNFSGHLFQYCWNAKTGATWLGGSGCGGLVGQYWIGTQDVSADLTVTGNNITGNLTLTGSGCNGANGFSGGFDTATHGTAGSNWGTLTFSK